MCAPFTSEKSGAASSAYVQVVVFWPTFPKVHTKCCGLLALTLVQAQHSGLNLGATTDIQAFPEQQHKSEFKKQKGRWMLLCLCTEWLELTTVNILTNGLKDCLVSLRGWKDPSGLSMQTSCLDHVPGMLCSKQSYYLFTSAGGAHIPLYQGGKKKADSSNAIPNIQLTPDFPRKSAPTLTQIKITIFLACFDFFSFFFFF